MYITVIIYHIYYDISSYLSYRDYTHDYHTVPSIMWWQPYQIYDTWLSYLCSTIIIPVQYHYSQSVALATERVHQKRFIAGSLIHLLSPPPPGGYRLLHFPRNSMCQKCTTSKYSRPRLFRCNEKTAPTIFPQIAHDRGIVDPRTCANFLKKIRCRFCATGAGRKMRTGGCGGHVLKPNLLIR